MQIPPTSLPADCVLPNDALLGWHADGTISSCVEADEGLLEPKTGPEEGWFPAVEDCSS